MLFIKNYLWTNKRKNFKEIGSFLPECKVYYLQYYIWQQLSGIAVHDDHDKVFGATIYLNDTWQPENGGIFLYKEKESSASAHEWSALLPNNNTMVVNDNHEKAHGNIYHHIQLILGILFRSGA